jgi:hypothetical protein
MGWDAITGYLQTSQRVSVYAFLPSHYGYSDLPFEELAILRAQLLKILEDEGVDGIKRFSRRMRNERRIKPDKVLKLNKTVYGIPDAGQSFNMFMQSLHLKKCSIMTQISEIGSLHFYKIMQRDVQDANGGKESVSTEYLLAITWVDDVRYFETEEMVTNYEKTINENCRCIFEGVSKDFVSIQILHDVDAKILELRQEDYW